MEKQKKGFKPKGMKMLPTEKKSDAPTKVYTYDPRPEMSVKSTELPEIKEWEVGEEYNLMVRVKMESFSDNMNSESGKAEQRATLRIVGLMAKENKENKDNNDKEEEYS